MTRTSEPARARRTSPASPDAARSRTGPASRADESSREGRRAPAQRRLQDLADQSRRVRRLGEHQAAAATKTEVPASPAPRSGDEGSHATRGAMGSRAPVQMVTTSRWARYRFRKEYPLAATLVEDIDLSLSDNEILYVLINRFNGSGFMYSMAATQPDDFLKGRLTNGDCSTLVRSYVKIAVEYFGIPGVGIGSKLTDFFVPGGGAVLDSNHATGNVDGGAHWAFTNHYWVTSPIGNIDLLFRGQPLNAGPWIDRTGEGTLGGRDYRTFGDYTVYPDQVIGPLANRYTTV